jgi:hypothetical protein
MATIGVGQCLGALVACGACFAGAAWADTLSFDELRGGGRDFFAQVEVQGYRLASDAGSDDALGIWSQSTPYQADPEGAALFVNRSGSSVTLQRLDASPFDFHGLDVTDLLNTGAALALEFGVTYMDGRTETEVVVLPAGEGLRTVHFARSSVRSLSWRSASQNEGWLQFDNVVASVTEP